MSLSSNTSSMLTFHSEYHLSCDIPHYIYLSGVASLVTIAIFFKMAAWLKLLLMIPMLIGYLVVTLYTHAQLFIDFDVRMK